MRDPSSVNDKNKGQPVPCYSEIERLQRREARRKAQRRRHTAMTMAGIGVALGCGIFIGVRIEAGTIQSEAAAIETSAPTAKEADFSAIVERLSMEERLPMNDPAELWSDDTSRISTPLLSADLEAETQWAIYDLCGQDDSLFCAVMAIAKKETGFRTDAVGDNGVSIGMMQINTNWHTERMEALGVTDLTDPVQCAAVAIDYIEELAETLGVWTDSHYLYMAYNMGPVGARSAITAGTYSTAYSRQVMVDYEAYLAELGS